MKYSGCKAAGAGVRYVALIPRGHIHSWKGRNGKNRKPEGKVK
jgi:hypothetical protein